MDEGGARLRGDAGADGADGPAPWPLAERPGFLMRRLHQIHVSLFSELCGAFRVTPLQYSLLSLLRARDGADQTTLALAVALDRTTTTGALKRLQARGLVERSPSPADRRAQHCRLTPEGCALLLRMEGAARQAHALTLAPLSPAEQATLIHLMKKVTAAHGQRRDAGDGMV
ncbi:MarR family transcriptional regulator [Methylobacterium sp. Leaf99]|uniref:MarR family winged helix-turn-helix transcriptional regulator n=2 Tax=Methylobacterium TaxID=407 RepID=UPI0009EBE3BB